MGTIFQGKCPQCGYEAKLFLGGGMRDCYPETALAAVPKNKALISALKKKIPFWIERQGAICHKCNKLVAGVRVIYQKGDKKKVIEGVCPFCGGELEWPESNDISCPVCGKTLSFIPTGHWD